MISLSGKGCVPLRCQQCSSDEQNEKIGPLWFRFLNIWKGLFKEMFGEACFLLHQKEDLESQEGKAIFALRQDAGRQMLFFCFYF